jgi:hypothetical protein
MLKNSSKKVFFILLEDFQKHVSVYSVSEFNLNVIHTIT